MLLLHKVKSQWAGCLQLCWSSAACTICPLTRQVLCLHQAWHLHMEHHLHPWPPGGRICERRHKQAVLDDCYSPTLMFHPLILVLNQMMISEQNTAHIWLLLGCYPMSWTAAENIREMIFFRMQIQNDMRKWAIPDIQTTIDSFHIQINTFWACMVAKKIHTGKCSQGLWRVYINIESDIIGEHWMNMSTQVIRRLVNCSHQNSLSRENLCCRIDIHFYEKCFLSLEDNRFLSKTFMWV